MSADLTYADVLRATLAGTWDPTSVTRTDADGVASDRYERGPDADLWIGPMEPDN